MTDRKPDFYVVRVFDWVEKKIHYLSSNHIGASLWTEDKAHRARYATFGDAEHAASVVACPTAPVPVFCTSRRAEPKMRERSSAWVLKRLAEGKVLYRPRHEAGSLMFSETLIRWEPVDGMIEFCVPGEMVWSSKRGQLCFDGKILCRIARPSEVPQ